MIRTSAHGRSARGRAAETAASPPTRTKSSISVVTNRTFKKRPLKSPCNVAMQEKVQFPFQSKGKGDWEANKGRLGGKQRRDRSIAGKRFPAAPAQTRVSHRTGFGNDNNRKP